MIDKTFIFNYLPRGGVGLEIGVWKGEFSEQILQHLMPQKLYLCDPWVFTPQFPDRWYGGTQAQSQEDMNRICGEVHDKLARYQDKTTITFLRTSSNALPTLIKPGSLDWCYIDGDHSYDQVLADLRICMNLVMPGGFIVGDDYEVGNDIQRAFTRFLDENRDQFSVGDIINRQFIYQKKQ